MKSGILLFLWVMMSVLSYSQYTYEYAFAPEKWSTPTIVADIKDTYATEPYLSADGRKLFFNNGRYVEKTDTGWSKVKELGPQINGNLMRNACISPDSKLLVFTWWYYGGWDLFYSEWDSLKQDWGAAKWGGYELNNEEYEIGCSFPNDTTMIYLKDGYTSISFWNKRTKTWSAAKLWPAEIQIYSYAGIHVTPDMKKVYSTMLLPRILPSGHVDVNFDVTVKYKDTTLTQLGNNGYTTRPMPLNFVQYSDSMYLAGKFSEPYEGQPTLTPDGKTMYLVAAFDDRDARIFESHMIIDEHGEPVGVREKEKQGAALPEESLTMYPPYPNPFNPETTVKYSLSREMKIKATLYDISGERVRELKEGIDSPGEHTLRVRTDGLSSGIYLIHLQSPYQSLIEKAVVVK